MAKSFRKMLKGKDAFNQAHDGMLSLRADFAANTFAK